MWADPVVVRYIRPTPFNEEETWARVLRYVGHWALLGFGFWVVEDKETGGFLGEAGFLNFHRDTEPPGDQHPRGRLGLSRSRAWQGLRQ